MNTMRSAQITPRNRLFKCLAISLVAHTAVLSYFYFHPLILQSPFKSLFGMNAAQPTLLENEEERELLFKNHLLDEVFQKIVVLSPHYQRPFDLIELPKGIALSPNLEETLAAPELSLPNLQLSENTKKFTAASEITPIDETDVLSTITVFNPPDFGGPIASQLQIDKEISLIQPPFFNTGSSGEIADMDLKVESDFPLVARQESNNALNLLPKDLSFAPMTDDDLGMMTHPHMMTMQGAASDLSIEQEQAPARLFIPKMGAPALAKRTLPSESISTEPSEYDFPSTDFAAEWNEDFDVDITFLPTPEGKGYIFSLALSPNCDISSHSLKQNLYFIIDRSSSVQKHRFAVFKRAVLKALSSMQQGDTFNILVMDRKIARFSPENRPVSLKNINAAEEFLDKQDAGGFFNTADIYTKLGKILPSIPENDEMHTAILLTDGKTSMNAEKKQTALKNWIQNNQGKVSLYTCAIGADNDLLTLDMFSLVSGGKLLYSDTHASFPRKLSKLVLDLKDPIAKDLSVSVIPHNPNSNIEFYTANSQLPSLYGHQPYVLVGKIDEPGSFDLVIQGRHQGNWIAIKKNISFIDGHKGDDKLEKLWNAQHAGLCYAKFIKEGKLAHLKEAKQILKKSRSEVAFE